MRATLAHRKAVDAATQFRAAIQDAGLTPPNEIQADGKLRRFPTNGKRSDDAGWYLMHGDGIPAGCFGDWRTGFSQTWRANIGRTLSPAEEAAHRARVEAMRREREAEEAKRREDAATTAAAVWETAVPASWDHPYLVQKGIKANGLKVQDGRLVVPMRTGGELHSLQYIGQDGYKRFLTGGRVTGCYFSIGSMKDAAALCIAEGYATGASIHEATGKPVAVAFNAGNLLPVAKAMREKYPVLTLIICADDDAGTDGNPGLSKATAAAQAVNGLLAVPDFGADRPDSATDFNDLAAAQGPDAVLRCIEAAASVAEVATVAVANGAWQKPQPLTAKIKPEPYPLDALPDTIRAAVQEVQGFIQSPVPLVASSALAALSVACQAHVDIKRADKLAGPSGVFLLSIADSGERKSTCDGFFAAGIRQFQDEQAEAMKPELECHKVEIDAWTAKRDGLLSAIKDAAKKGKPTSNLQSDLAKLQREKPEAPKVPRLLLGDETPENLAWSLARQWPSAGVLSSEAGLIFGAHGMGKDSVMRNLGLLNVLWDGGTHSVGRRTSECFTVKGARLTVALQIQEATLRAFFERSGGLARGTGFLARFLVAWPESTQGYRTFTEAPPNWPHLAEFHRRIAAILANPVPMDEDGSLSLAMLTLSPEAKAAWVAFHDAIEGELRSGGELYDVRDVASKSADNAARLAGLFQIFEHGMGGAIGLPAFEGASRIAAWHLSESRRFFGELALPDELADVVRLDAWLIGYCMANQAHIIPTREAQRLGPGCVRTKDRLTAALRELEDMDRLRIAKEGRRKIIRVNPYLLGIEP